MGRGSLYRPIHFQKQQYNKLRASHLKQKTLFSDPTFQDVSSSVGDFPNVSSVEWKRPKDLCNNPLFFARDTTSPEHVVAGPLSSQWFVSALTVMASIGEICGKVIPDQVKQEWDPEEDEYAGIFHFRFWRFGHWVDVVIDDKLPVSGTQILSTHSNRSDEFWVSLVEKAYVKLHGSYEAMTGGLLANALVDFTGGVCEVMDLRSEDYEIVEKLSLLFALLASEMNQNSIMVASVAATSDGNYGVRTEMGLYIGHAYCITSVKKVHLGESNIQALFRGREKISMVRLRDPHGVESNVHTDEHKSEDQENAYSTSRLTRLLSRNPNWSRIKDSEKSRLGLSCETAEEFWMPLEDFAMQFTELVVCRMPNTNIFAFAKIWRESAVTGLWTTGTKGSRSDRAGGCESFPDTFMRNPQYMFDIEAPEDILMIQMLQWDTSNKSFQPAIPILLITFYVIKVEDNRKYRLCKQWSYNPTVVSIDPMRKRDLFYSGRLSHGRYILIPAAHKPGDTGGFCIRIFGSLNVNLRDIKRDSPRTKVLCFSVGYPLVVTVVHIKSAEGLKQFHRLGACDAFCRIDCERKSGKTAVVRNCQNPVWNTSFVFYRSKTDKPIRIRLYHHKLCFPDQFMGQVKLPAPVNQQPTVIYATLMDRKTNDPMPTQGKLVLEVYTTDKFSNI